MSREINRQSSRPVGTRWERFLRSVKRVITAVSFIVIAAVVGLLTQRATDMPVQEIAILGDMQHVSRATVESVIGPHVSEGFLLTDLAGIRADLEALPWVFEVKVRREWPGTVHVHVTEEQPIARWGEAAYINPQGVVFDGSSFDRYAELPQLWSEHSAPVALIEQFKLFQMLLTPHGLGVSVLKEDRLGQISAELTDGTSVQFGDKDFAQRVRRFAVLLGRETQENSITRIDFRYERGAAVLRQQKQFAVTTVAQERGGR